MPRKKMTPEERKAFGERMKAAREAKKNQPRVDQKVAAESRQEAAVANEDVAALLKRIEELESKQFFTQPQVAVRAITKYSILPSDYPDPRERLADEPKLQEHAFKQNFTLRWEVGKVQYPAQDGVNYTEPKFRLELWRWIRDPETQELTTKQYRVHKATFFEDPDAAIQMASVRGHDIDESLQKPFLDEMRYLRMRDWLMEIFYPPKPTPNQGVREEVIGNRLVAVYETAGEQPQSIPFDKLKI